MSRQKTFWLNGKPSHGEWCWCVCIVRALLGIVVLILAVGYITLVFLAAVEEEERSVIHIKIVPFVLMRTNVCEYPMYMVCGFLYFLGCIENECVEIFYENVWGNSVDIGKDK